MHIPTCVAVIAAFILSSCAGTQSALSANQAKQLRGHTLSSVRQQTGPFGCATPSQALLAGALAMGGGVDEINAMIARGGRGMNLPPQDPGEQIEQALSSHFNTALAMKVGPHLVVPTQKPYERKAATPDTGADYRLEIGPVGWGATYFPMNWLRYRVGVSAQVQLVESKTGKVIAKSMFGASPTKTSDHIRHSDLKANTNGVVTRQVAEATSQIIENFTQKVFIPTR